MAYTKYHDPWADADGATGGGDESTPLIAAALDHIEDGIGAAATVADAAATVADAAIPDPGGATTASALVWNGSAWVADTITNARIAANAAISVSKLAPGTNGQLLSTSAGSATWGGLAHCALGTSVTSSQTNGVWQLVTAWDTERSDPGGWHEGVTHPARITVPTTGIYLVSANIVFSATTTIPTNVGVQIQKNSESTPGTPLIYSAWSGLGTGISIGAPTSGVVSLTANDYLVVVVFLSGASGPLLGVGSGFSAVQIA